MWLCAKHWKMVDPSLREEHKAAKRELRKFRRRKYRASFPQGTFPPPEELRRGMADSASCSSYLAFMALRQRELAAWIACVKDAIIADKFGMM
jgi:hypothetical protein